jgi:hypothetical protein
VVLEGAQNSVKKGVHFGTRKSRVSVHASHEALIFHSPVAHPGSPCSRGASVQSGMVWVSVKVSLEGILVLLCCCEVGYKVSDCKATETLPAIYAWKCQGYAGDHTAKSNLTDTCGG